MTYLHHTTLVALGAPGQAGGWVHSEDGWPHKQTKSEYMNNTFY